MKKGLLICLSILITSMLLFANNRFNSGNFVRSANVNTQRGDTLEFRANAYVIQPNDKLEDLLRRISAISVDKNGKVYSQGDVVTKLLVDGEEFFSDDVSVAGHVLRADEVDKIKIYWRLGDQASFTNVEDNVKIKTMNVILKKEK